MDDVEDPDERSRRRTAVWSDEDFVQDAPAEYDEFDSDDRAPRRGRRAGRSGPIGGRAHVFLPGMTVWHPDYGTGIVVSVSGTGLKRKAQVQFVQGGDAKSFLIAAQSLGAGAGVISRLTVTGSARS